MPLNSKRVFVVTTPQEWAALGSTTAILLVQAVQHLGRATVSEIAEAIGIRQTAIYHHVARLLRVGLLRQVGLRRSHVGPAGAVYAFAPRVIRLDFEARSQRNVAEAKRLFKVIFRATERQFLAAIESGAVGEATRNLDWSVFVDGSRLDELTSRRVVNTVRKAHETAMRRKARPDDRRATLFVAFFHHDVLNTRNDR